MAKQPRNNRLVIRLNDEELDMLNCICPEDRSKFMRDIIYKQFDELQNLIKPREPKVYVHSGKPELTEIPKCAYKVSGIYSSKPESVRTDQKERTYKKAPDHPLNTEVEIASTNKINLKKDLKNIKMSKTSDDALADHSPLLKSPPENIPNPFTLFELKTIELVKLFLRLLHGLGFAKNESAEDPVATLKLHQNRFDHARKVIRDFAPGVDEWKLLEDYAHGILSPSTWFVQKGKVGWDVILLMNDKTKLWSRISEFTTKKNLQPAVGQRKDMI